MSYVSREIPTRQCYCTILLLLVVILTLGSVRNSSYGFYNCIQLLFTAVDAFCTKHMLIQFFSPTIESSRLIKATY